jgi:hypothetical protein
VFLDFLFRAPSARAAQAGGVDAMRIVVPAAADGSTRAIVNFLPDPRLPSCANDRPSALVCPGRHTPVRGGRPDQLAHRPGPGGRHGRRALRPRGRDLPRADRRDRPLSRRQTPRAATPLEPRGSPPHRALQAVAGAGYEHLSPTAYRFVEVRELP